VEHLYTNIKRHFTTTTTTNDSYHITMLLPPTLGLLSTTPGLWRQYCLLQLVSVQFFGVTLPNTHTSNLVAGDAVETLAATPNRYIGAMATTGGRFQ